MKLRTINTPWIAIAWLIVTSTAAADGPAACLVSAARDQIGVTVHYDPAYRRIDYPNGDVPSDRGVCTDVLVRAYRTLGLDLQSSVHEDMEVAWSDYPDLWQLSRPDANIDHRRVPNLAAFFSRHGQVLPVSRQAADYAAGDIVTWRLDSGVPHIGLISERRASSGEPLVIHNIGRGVLEENVLFAFTITGHFRYLPNHLSGACIERISHSGAQ